MPVPGLDALLDYLRATTRSWDQWERRIALEEVLPIAYAVGAAGTAREDAVATLGTLLGSSAAHVRRHAAQALAEVLRGAGGRGLAALAQLDLDADPRWRDALPLWTIACLAGGDWASEETRVLGILAHPSPARRKRAWAGMAVAFGDSGDERAVEAVLSSLRPSDDMTTRFAALASAASVLGRHARLEQVAALMAVVPARGIESALSSGSNPLLPVAEALRGGGAASAFAERYLMPLIGRAGPGRAPALCRAAAIAAIGAAAPDGAAQSLWRHLADPVRAVRWTALWAIPRLYSPDDRAAVPPPSDLSGAWLEACEALCLGAVCATDLEAERVLVGALRSRSALVASSGALGLARAFRGAGDALAADGLERAVEGHASWAWAAALALGMIRSGSGCEEAARALSRHASRARSRAAAAACLAGLGLVSEGRGSGAASELLVGSLRHSDAGAACLGARGLGAAFLGPGAWMALEGGWERGPWHYALGAQATGQRGIWEENGFGVDGLRATR